MGQIIAPLIHSDDFAKLKNIFLAKNFFLKKSMPLMLLGFVLFCTTRKIFFKANPEDKKEKGICDNKLFFHCHRRPKFFET